MDTARICELIDEHKDELFSLLSKLIQFNSENFGSHGNEQEVAEYIHNLCLEWGFESDIYSPLELEGFTEHPDYWPGRHLENRPNVTARWKGIENTDTVMLMAHSDTVPIGNPKGWKYDPLGGEIIDGKIYGRGACDDKFGIAQSMFLMKLLKDEGFVPKSNVLMTAYSDEESGGSHGALAAVMKYPSKIYVNLDAGINELWNCAAGGQVLRYSYETKKTVDTAETAASVLPIVLEEMKTFQNNRRNELEANPYFTGTDIPATSMRYGQIGAGINGSAPGIGEMSFTFYTDKPKEEIDAELLELEQRIAKRLDPLGFVGGTFERQTRFFHYGACATDCQAIKDFQAAALEASGRELRPCGSCLSDMSIILKHGGGEVFSYGCAQGFGDEGGAHQPDEFVRCDDLVEVTKMLGAYILRVLG